MSEREEQEQRRKQKRKQKKKQRRKKDCMLTMPFIIAFQGDPAQAFYCNDVINSNHIHDYELIHPNDCGMHAKPLARLKAYLGHHILNLSGKILVFKAGEERVPEGLPDYYGEQEEREDED